MAIPASNGKTVLITGINGYIASVLGQLLLRKGYSVRGTTRRLASTDPLLKGAYEPYQDQVTIYEVPDMTVSGAFDEAVRGVHGIFHTASPVNFSLDSYEQTVIPAVKGSETILNSALKAGPQLESVVVTSSTVAVTNPTEVPDYEFTEKDFAHIALERAIKERDDGVKTPGGVLYSASKTAAERAVWKFRDEHKPAFTITTINPSVVVGPPVVLPATGAQLNETLLPIFNLLSGTAKTIGPNIGSGSFVDVRDVAFMHVWAFENHEKANGERYLACEGFGPLQGAADILHYKYKGTKIAEKIPVGEPGKAYLGYDKESGEVGHVEYAPGTVRVNGKKAEMHMGFEYISYRKSVEDTADVLEALL